MNDEAKTQSNSLPISDRTLNQGAGSNIPTVEWLPIWKPSDFTNFEPPKDFILVGDCHLTRGGLTVIGGWPGVGKSRAALALAIAGAKCVPWMGHPVHAHFRTLIIQCDNGPFRLKTEN